MVGSISSIKRAQKESLIFREISRLIVQTAMDDPRLQDIYINRVQLSPDKSICTVYFYTALGEEAFNKTLRILTLYKPSLRKALAAKIAGRYVPDLVFKFDKNFEKQQRIEHLIEKTKEDE